MLSKHGFLMMMHGGQAVLAAVFYSHCVAAATTAVDVIASQLWSLQASHACQLAVQFFVAGGCECLPPHWV